MNCSKCEKPLGREDELDEVLAQEFRIAVMCPECEKITRRESVKAGRVKRFNSYLSGLPRDYQEQITPQGFENSVEWFEDADAYWCVVLSGIAGCGKSKKAHQTIAQIYAIKDYKGCFKTANQLISSVQHDYKNRSTLSIARYINTDLLVIDDYGIQKQTEDSQNILDEILFERERKRLKTIITTNASREVLEKNVGERIASRLAKAKFVSMPEIDHRRA